MTDTSGQRRTPTCENCGAAVKSYWTSCPACATPISVRPVGSLDTRAVATVGSPSSLQTPSNPISPPALGSPEVGAGPPAGDPPMPSFQPPAGDIAPVGAIQPLVPPPPAPRRRGFRLGGRASAVPPA